MSILLEIYKSHERFRIVRTFSAFVLITPILTNIFPVDLYHLQVYNIVDIIQITKYPVISWFVTEICLFVRPTQTSILAASTHMFMALLSSAHIPIQNQKARLVQNISISSFSIITLNHSLIYVWQVERTVPKYVKIPKLWTTL